MQQSDSATTRAGSTPAGQVSGSPVDDYTYDLLQALTSKLEAIEAYNMYAEDEEDSDLFRQLAAEDRRHAERLLEALRQRLGR